MNTPLTLVRMQETDDAIARAQRRLDAMPEKQAILATRKKLGEVRDLKVRAEKVVKADQTAVSRLEDEAAVLDEKMEHEQKKILSGEITNPKELQNISRELDALKRRRDALDNETLAAMEKLEKDQAQIARIDDAVSQLSAREQKLVNDFKSTGGALQTEIDKLVKGRESLAKGLDAELRQRYDALKASKQGTAVGTLSGGTCTACRFEIPGTAVKDLKAGPDVAVCPMCRRILVVRFEHED